MCVCVVGGALILLFFSAIAIGQVVLWSGELSKFLFLACFSYLGLIAAMGYEMSIDMLHRAKLSRQLQASEADSDRGPEAHGTRSVMLPILACGCGTFRVMRFGSTHKGRALFFGFGASEKLDLDRFKNVLHPEDRQRVLEAVENTLRTSVDY